MDAFFIKITRLLGGDPVSRGRFSGEPGGPVYRMVTLRITG